MFIYIGKMLKTMQMLQEFSWGVVSSVNCKLQSTAVKGKAFSLFLSCLSQKSSDLKEKVDERSG